MQLQTAIYPLRISMDTSLFPRGRDLPARPTGFAEDHNKDFLDQLSSDVRKSLGHSVLTAIEYPACHLGAKWFNQLKPRDKLFSLIPSQ